MSIPKPALLAAVCLYAIIPAAAQTGLINCIVTAEAPLLRTENHAERVGDLRITCTGGDPNEVRFVNITLFLDAPMTSDLTGETADETEALLLIDDPQPGVPNVSNGVTYEGQVKGRSGVSPGPPGGPGVSGSGNVYAGSGGGSSRIVWDGVPFVPAPPGFSRVFRLVNVRADVTRLVAQPGTPLSVTAFVSVSPSTSLPVTNPQVVVGRALPSLSSAPTNEPGGFTLRYEEAYTTAFRKRIENTTVSATSVNRQNVPEAAYFTESGFTPDYESLGLTDPGVADSGTRFVARFTNLPVGAYIVAPTSVSAIIPGAGLGMLQVRRVLDFGPNFSGGSLMTANARNELVPIVNGQATMVYEVVAQAPFEGINDARVIDRFDIPVQIIFPQPVSIGSASLTMGYAPADPTSTFSGPAPEPRFSTYESGTVSYPVRAGPTLAYVTFSYVQGDPLPLLKDFKFDGVNPAISDSLTVLPQTGGNWLAVTGQSAPSTATIRLAANPSGLAPGRYFSGVSARLESAPSDLLVIPAILDILPPPELLLETTPINFRVFAGDSPPLPRIVYLTAKNRAVDFTLAASTSSGGNWLSVSASGASTPANLSIAVDSSSLPPGSYEGAISVRAPNAANSPQTIRVILVVADRSPVFETAAVVNAASYQGGGIAPTEIVTFFGTGIGPPAPAGPVIDANGRFSTLVAGTRILFGGIPAPIIAVSRTQSSAVVPAAVGTFTSVDIQIEVDGTRSQPVTVPVARTAPGLFTTNAQGSGQGAILNQDLSPNSEQNPADRGSVVAIYLTGGGATEPQTIDGAITGSANLPRIPIPVSVTIGGIDALVEYAGAAPGAVAGLYQINARINASVAPGSAVPVVVAIGNASSQSGVTLAVR